MADTLPSVALLTDDLFLRSRLEQLIELAGAEVRLAGTSESVSALLRSETPPRAVVLDLAAGHVDATAVIEQLRQRFPGIPIVAFGPHTDRESLAAATRSGCSSVLPRSRAVRELTSEVRKALQG